MELRAIFGTGERTANGTQSQSLETAQFSRPAGERSGQLWEQSGMLGASAWCSEYLSRVWGLIKQLPICIITKARSLPSKWERKASQTKILHEKAHKCHSVANPEGGSTAWLLKSGMEKARVKVTTTTIESRKSHLLFILRQSYESKSCLFFSSTFFKTIKFPQGQIRNPDK